MKVHQIKIDFNVTNDIKRYVYVYVIEAKYLYLIDSGVYGSEKEICKYIESINRSYNEIKGIFLTHAHPDHIGSANWFKENTNCKIYASKLEARWIEDIDLEFKERPIPNFYNLAGKSTKIDIIVKDNDIIKLEDIEVKVIKTAGHSAEEISYLILDNFFIGDSIPVKGDIPIFINEKEIRNTIDIIRNINANTYYPAWDFTYTKDIMNKKLDEALALINLLKNTVLELDNGNDLNELVDLACDKLNMKMLKQNPLFNKTIECLREMKCYFIVDVYINENRGKGAYSNYIEKVKPIVESYGGKYITRSENITSLSENRNPQRVIIIEFPSKDKLNECFNSNEYKAIMNERIDNVDARALIVE